MLLYAVSAVQAVFGLAGTSLSTFSLQRSAGHDGGPMMERPLTAVS
jgi:hypothetical protein